VKAAALALGVISFLFLCGFLVQRARSDALATLRLRADVEAVAREAGVEPGLAMALVWERGGRLCTEEIASTLREYLDLLARFGAPVLALCAFAGERSAVERCLAETRGDAEKAAGLILRRPEGLAAVRLQSMAKRLGAGTVSGPEPPDSPPR
jgi:hypothetical protein